jgi:hypothetical protein
VENNLRARILPLFDSLIKQLSQELEKQDQHSINLFWIEIVVFRFVAALAIGLMSELIVLFFNRGYEGCYIPCQSCGQQMKFQPYRLRPIISCCGSLRDERAYYYCGQCHRGNTPLDEQIGIGHRQLSRRLQRLIAFHAGHLSFGVVEQTLNEGYKLEISEETIRHAAEESGDKARCWEDAQRQLYQQPESALPRRARVAKTWIIEVDGKQVGLQDGSWREVKVGVIDEVAARVEIHPGRHQLIKREVVARRCHWEEFAEYFWAAMPRAGIAAGDRLVAMADGAESMEQIFAWVAPEAERIGDFYHVSEKVHVIGEVRFGSGSRQAQAWVGLQLHKLKGSAVSEVVRSIAHLKFADDHGDETRAEVLRYLANHRAAMDYVRYQQEGLPIGSGAVEGGCRLIGLRTNGCGRRWGLEGCDSIVALRVAVLNERLDEIHPRPAINLKLAA